jgi:hypothetical protein
VATLESRVSIQRMRILVQRKTDGLYFQDIDSWVSPSAEAMDFVSSGAAIDFCVLNKIKDVQIVLKFDEQRYDIVLPVVGQPGGEKRSTLP